MKRKLTFLLAAVLLLLIGPHSFGQTRDSYLYTFSAKQWSDIGTVTLNNVDWTAEGTASSGYYFGYDATKGQQFGSGNKPFSSLTVSTSGITGTITSIKVETSGASNITGTMNVTVGGDAFGDIIDLTKTNTEYTFSGSAEGAICLNYNQTSSKAIYLKKIEITYSQSGGQQTVATPTFTPAGGNYTEAQNVTISCATSGATIYYTTDGTTPTTSSDVYSSPIAVSTTTTIKAIGVKSGMTNSSVASATYNFPTLITIAEAKALANNAYGMVQGIVTLIDSRNIYIQDATGGIDLYLNSNTVPSGLALGDMVQAYGKKTTYNGLIELTGINGNNAGEFSILSSGNTLPLAVKTIAEINAGASNTLQATRIKVENAVLGTINTNDNTTLTQDGNVINIYKIPALTGISEGDVVNVTAVVGYFNTAQLRVAYATDVELAVVPQQTVATPTFTPEGGTFTEAQSVSIACATTGATIYYTTDGTTPSATSTVYAAPISVNETTTIKAIAMKEGMTNSEIAEATYTIEIPSEPVTFTKVTNVGCINTTNHYLLVCESASTAANGTVANSGLQAGSITINSGSITTEVDATGKPSTITLEAAEGGYYLKFSNGKYANNTSSTGISLSTTPSSIWAINSNEAGFILQNTSNSNRFIGGTNESATVYKAYATSNFDSYPLVVLYFDGTAPTNPELTVSATQLEGFTYEQGVGPSEPQSFTVSGSNLTSNIVITAPENFEIALSGDSTYLTTITLPFGEGQVASTSINVRLAAGLVRNSYSGNLSVATAGADTKTVALSGSVTMSNAVATPTFSPAGGTFISTQSVSILCETEGATIYYTTNGETPTTESNVYSAPLTVSATTTIKALAVKQNYLDSEIATATFTFQSVMTIAEARALSDNEYALVEGIVTFIDGRNVYVQDATAGIDLYLNSSTVPTTLALGDEIRAYGKKTTYNGLVELTGINGASTSEFVIESTDNELPNEVKTLAEILADFSADNMLQATRVTVENAIVGTINPTSTTVITQDGSSINVYRLPVPEGMTAGDRVTLTGIIGCNNNTPQLRVASVADVEFTHRPQIVITPATISGLTYEYEEGPSEIANFIVSGNYLTGDVFIEASDSFELSTFDGDSFSPENPVRIIPPMSGHIYGLKVYCRLKAGLEPGTYNELQTAYSQDGDTVQFRLIGTVTGGVPPTPPTGDDYIRIADLSQLTDGCQVVFAARFDENATNYYAMSNTSSGKPTGVLFTSTTSGSDETLPSTIVDEEDSFYWTVGVTANGYTFTNAAGQLIGYSSGTNFSTGGDNTEWSITNETAGDGAMVPYYQGFVIGNVNNNVRAFALNSSHNFGPYHIQNMNGDGYNFYLDLFVKSQGGTPVVSTPTFTPAAGTYYEAQNVTINCSTEGATIYYTLDGTEPTTESSVYSAPIEISETTTIKAMAIKTDYENSAIAEATYTIQLGVVVIFNQDWEGEMNGWTFVDVEGTATWEIGQFSGNHYANINGYNKGANTDWCISPAFNLNNYDNPVLTFKNAKKYEGQDLQVYFSNDYDGSNPATATWTELDAVLSESNFTWIESGDIDLSNFSGTNCYIGFKYTCTEDEAAAWEIDDCLLVGQTSEPVISASPLALNGFTYIENNGPSAEQSFIVSALNLSEDLTITAADNFEISATTGAEFNSQATITLTPANGTIAETTIYVRMAEGLAHGDYDGTIAIASEGANALEITCAGSVIEEGEQSDYIRIADAGELVDGNRVILAARYDGNATNYVALANVLTSGKLNTTEFTSTMSGDDEVVPTHILLNENDYYWTVGITDNGYTFTNANGDVIGYGNSGTNFSMNSEKTEWIVETATSDSSTMVPNYFGFNIINYTTTSRAFALNTNHVCGAYSTSNLTSDEYNFYLDIFMQGEGGTPTVAAPTFTPAAGTYFETQEVSINCATADAEIFYSLVSEEGPWTEYTETISVEYDLTIWAYAEKEGYNNSAVVSADYVINDDLVIIFNQDWEDDWNGWTQVSVEGETAEWTIAEHTDNHYAYMNAYNQGANEDWLISPAFDLDASSNVALNFRSAMNYTGPDVEVFFSNDYDGQDPTMATWQALSCNLSQGSWTWTESGEISLDEFSGSNCYIAYRYTSTETEAAGWEIDDIILTSGINTDPTLTVTPNNIIGLTYIEGEGPSESQTYTISAANLEGEGEVMILVTEGFEISLDDETYGEELEIAYTDGQIVDQPVTIYVRMAEGLEIGEYDGVIMHEGGEAYTEVDLAGEVISAEQPYIDAFMPMYIQGNNGSNNNRIPVAIAVYLENLEPNTTYRYTNQFVDANDGETVAGAGNVIYANPDGFYRSTNPSLSTEGGYGEFTTDDSGEGFAWFINEATANTRFTPGNQVYLRIRINDGHDGTSVDQIFTTEDYATVLNFGTENDEFSGSSFYAKSEESPMTFAMMFSSDDDWRPTYSTSIETTGVDYAGISQYANFYKDEVAGKDGYFGGILPNSNEYGINIIWILDLESYVINDYYTEDGMWGETNTVNPSNGLNDPMFIDLTYDNVNEEITSSIKIWSAGNEIRIDNPDGGRFVMTVTNILGQNVMTQNVNGEGLIRINHNLTSGLYIVTLMNNDTKLSAKIIVK